VRWRWHWFWHQVGNARRDGLRRFVRQKATRTALWTRDRIASASYVELAPHEVARQRRSETVFIFGSGYSLNELQPAEWTHFARHDTFGFSGFIYQRWVRVDFHLIRSWFMEFQDSTWLKRVAEQYAENLRSNPHFSKAILFLQREFSAEFSNMLTGARLLSGGTRLCRYHAAHRLDDMPTSRWKDGILRDPGTLAMAVNMAYLLGWKRIVLVGVDLYDNRYFWGPSDGTVQFDDNGDYRRVTEENDRGIAWDAPHNTVRNRIVEILGTWSHAFSSHGVKLMVYNPRSLLATALPLYLERECHRAQGVHLLPTVRRRQQ
jgi:hypothetical protein